MLKKKFLHQLNYWINRGQYGVKYDGKTWIYNTLNDWATQFGVSKRTIQRAIKSLRDEGIIEVNYLSNNKRNRTLFYTINYEKFYTQKSLKHRNILKKNGHIIDHMIYIDNNNKIYKSYKSGYNLSESIASQKSFAKQNFQENNETIMTEVVFEQIPREKPNIVQKMVKSLTNIFPGLMKTFRLTKAICRNLVAAFQRKFHNSIEKWERYLKLIATSSYLNGEKFNLSVYWILKFLTIDRILNGEFGVNPDKITYTGKEQEKMEEKCKQQIQQKIDEINEPETCKQVRVKILEILGNDDYQQYFDNSNKCKFIEKNNEIIIELLGSEPWDFIYKAQKLEKIGIPIKIEWISEYIEIKQENGYKGVYITKSFEELEQFNTSKLQQNNEKTPNKPF